MKRTHISIILPVHNEEGNLEILNEKIKDAMHLVTPYYEVLYVDDGSTDRSFEVLSQMRLSDKHVKVIKFMKNFGQTAAMRAGFEHASGDIIVSMDADMQNDPMDIPLLVEKVLGGCDCVVGWRHDRKDPFLKKYMSVFARYMRMVFLGLKLHDYGCSLKAYTSACAKDLDIMGEMHRYITPIVVMKGYKVCEVKVRHHPRLNGKTKYGSMRIFRGFVDMLSIWFWKKYSGRPLHMFGGMGFLSMMSGGVLGSYSVFLKLFRGVDLSETFLPTVAVFLTMVGVQLFVSGIIADICVKTYYRSFDYKPYTIDKILE